MRLDLPVPLNKVDELNQPIQFPIGYSPYQALTHLNFPLSQTAMRDFTVWQKIGSNMETGCWAQFQTLSCCLLEGCCLLDGLREYSDLHALPPLKLQFPGVRSTPQILSTAWLKSERDTALCHNFINSTEVREYPRCRRLITGNSLGVKMHKVWCDAIHGIFMLLKVNPG